MVQTKKIEKYVLEYEFGMKPIIITFTNGSFYKVEFTFTSPYTREEWRILAKIELEISRIEKEKVGGGG